MLLDEIENPSRYRPSTELNSSGASSAGKCAVPASTRLCAPGMRRASSLHRSCRYGISRSPHITSVGVRIASRLSHADGSSSTAVPGKLARKAVLFIERKSSRVSPPTRPGGLSGPSSQAWAWSSFLLSRSPWVVAVLIASINALTASPCCGVGAPVTPGATTTRPVTLSGRANAASMAMRPPMELPTRMVCHSPTNPLQPTGRSHWSKALAAMCAIRRSPGGRS